MRSTGGRALNLKRPPFVTTRMTAAARPRSGKRSIRARQRAPARRQLPVTKEPGMKRALIVPAHAQNACSQRPAGPCWRAAESPGVVASSCRCINSASASGGTGKSSCKWSWGQGRGAGRTQGTPGAPPGRPPDATQARLNVPESQEPSTPPSRSWETAKAAGGGSGGGRVGAETASGGDGQTSGWARECVVPAACVAT